MSLIRETQDRSDPKNQVNIDVPKIGSTERLPEPPDVPDPMEQPSILPEAPVAPTTPYDVPDTVSDEQVSEAARSLTQFQQQQQQDFATETLYAPPDVLDIDLSHFESLGDAKLKGGVQPTYYEQNVTRVAQNAELNGPRVEFDEDLRFTESAILSGNYDLYRPTVPTAGITRMQDRSFGTVPNLDGIQPMGGRITLPGFVNSVLSNPNVGGNPGGARIFETYINEVFADLEQRFNLSEGVIGMDTSAIDNRAWGYREFEDGTVFNPFGNLALLKHAALNHPKAFLYSLPPTAKNPLGVFGALMMGSEWGDYPDGFIGALMYSFDFSRYFVAAGMDVWTTANGESTGRWEDSKTMQALQGRDFSIAAAQRVNPETGQVENPLSLWAQQKAEPKTWREWSQRNWLAKNIIVPIDKAKKLITGRSGLDDELSVPANLIGLQEFATGLIFDGFISAGATRAVEEVSVLQKNAQTAKIPVTPDDTLADLQVKSQAKEKAINKLRRKKFDRGTLTVDEQAKLDELIDQQQTILGYENQFEIFGEIRVTDGTEAAYLQALDETEQLLQEIEKQAPLLGDEAGNITIGSTIQRGQANLEAKADYAFGAPKQETGPATVVDLQPARPKVQTTTDYQYKAGQFDAMETIENGEKAARVPSVYDETSGTVKAQAAVDDNVNVPDPPIVRGPDIGTERANNLNSTQRALALDPTNPDLQQAARNAQFDYDQYLFNESPQAFQVAEETAQRAVDQASNRVASLWGQIAQAEKTPGFSPDAIDSLRIDLDEAIGSLRNQTDRLNDLETIKSGAGRPRTFLENLQDEAHELRILRGTAPDDRNVLNNLLEVERTLDEQMFNQFPEAFQGRKIAAEARVAGLRQRAAANQRRLQELQTNPASSVDDVQQRIALDEYYQREIEYAQIRADDVRALSQETEIVDPRLSAIEEFSQRVESQVLGGDFEGVAKTVDEVLEGAVVDAEAARVVEDVEPTDIQVDAARIDTDVFEARRQELLRQQADLEGIPEPAALPEAQAVVEPVQPTVATAVDITPEATVSTRAINNAVDEVVVPKVDELVEPQNLQQAVDDINEFEQSLLSTRQRLEELGATPEELAKVDAGLERVGLTKQYINSVYDPDAAKRLADRLKKVEIKNLDSQINTAQRTLEDRQAAISRGASRQERKELRAAAAEAQENLESLQKQRSDANEIRKQLGQADRLAEEVSLRQQFEFLENHPRLQGEQEKAFLKPFLDAYINAKSKTARIKAQKKYVEAANEAFATRILTNNPEFIAAKNTLQEQIRTTPKTSPKVKKQLEANLRALEAEFRPLKFKGLSTLDNIIKEVTELQKELTKRTTSDARKAVLQARIGRLEQLSDELSGVGVRPPSPAVRIRGLRQVKDLRSALTRYARTVDDPEMVATLREQLRKVINAEQRITPRAEPLEPTIAAADDIPVVSRVEPLQPTIAIADDITAAKQDFVNATNQVDQANAAARVQKLEAEQASANSRINDVRNRGTTRENYPKNISVPEAPNDFRFPDSSFNSTPPPKQRYVPHISKDGKVVNRSPLSEWSNDFEKAGKQMVRVGEITTHPDLIPLGKLEDISSENLGLLYQRVANQNADLLAIYKQEIVQVNKLAEQYPVGMTQAKSQTMAGGVPEQVSISVPNSKLGNFEKADGIPLASVKPVAEETYYIGTRLTNTADTFADPTSVAGRSPLGTVHTLTQDAFYAEDIAKSPVQNVPNSTSRAYNARTGTVLEVQVNAERVLNGSAKLPTGFKNELYNGLTDINSPQLKTIVGSNGGIEELARGFEDAIDKATNYKDLISRIDDAIEDWSVTRGFTEFDELASLQAQRAITRSLQASGIQAIEVTTRVKNKISKQLGVVDPAIIRATNFQQMDTGSVLEQVARQANAEVWQNRFYNKKATKSKFAKANAEKSKMQLAAQRVHETEKKLQQAHKNHADLATEMAKRENISEAEKLQRALERDAAIDKVFQGKNDKAIQTDLSRTLPETFKRAPKSEYLNDDYGEILNPDKSLRETKDLTEVWKTIPDSVNGVKASPDIKARMQRLRQQKRAAMSKQHQREAAEAMQEQAIRTEVETARQMYMGDKVNLRDTSLNPVQQWLAARFDMQWKMLQPLKRSGAGLIRKHLGLTAKIGNGLIETQVRMVMVNEAIRHNKLVKKILGKKGAGLTGKVLRQKNLDILEIGIHPKQNAGHELLPAALNVQKQRYDFLVDELKGFGVSDDDIFDLFESAISMSNKADEARVIANALGQNIGSVNQIGYFSRILDRDVAHWLKKLEDEGKPVRNKIVNPTAMDMDISKSRNTFHYVPEDLNVMSWLMGITRDELDRIIMNDEFAATLQKIDAANPGVLGNWVDQGILSKMQYTTNEVSELIIKKYGKDLPLNLRGDIFLDNPVKAWNMYGDYLKKQVERSAIYKDLVEDGLDAGWSVPKSVYDELPDELAPGVQGISKKDFVLWNEGSVRQFLPNYKGADIYVHKAVNNQVQSMVHLFGHPELMNTSSQIVSEISRFYNQSLLLHPFYSINVAVDSTMQFFAAGGDLLRLPQAYWDLGKALRTGNLEHFDNVTKAYWNWDGTKQLTQREFFEEFMLTNSIDITPFDLPGLGNEIGTTGKKWSSLVNPRRGMNWAWNYTRRFGAQNASTQFFRDIADVQGKFFQPLAAAASHAEAASKWALAQTWLDARPGNSIGQFLRDYGGNFPTRKIQSGKEAWDWMQDYYTTWNTAGAGAFGAATGFITPFSTYAYWNTPANIRKFMKNPQQYINYARIWGFLNRDMSIDDKINEYSVPSWLADNMSFALGKDSQGNWIMFRPRGMFSQGDIASAITLTGKTTARMMGFYPGSSQDQVNQILAEESDTRIFADLIEGFAPIYGKLGSLYTGEDIQGRPIANPNQVEGRLTGLNWRTEYLLSLYEPLGRLIRANPFNLLGQPEIIDSRTKVPIKAAVPGKILGSGERIEYDTTKYENPAGILKVMQYLGAPITIIDADRNLTWSLSRLGTTYNKVSQVRSTMHKEMVEMTQKGTDKTFPAKFAKLKRRHDDLMMKEIQLAKDFTILQEYFRVNNIVSSEDIRTVETAIYNEWLRQNPNVYQKILDRFRANEREIIDAFESTIKGDTSDTDFGVGGTEPNGNAGNQSFTDTVRR